MRTMQAVQIAKAGGLLERVIPEPPDGHLLIKVLARGICYSDSLTKEGLWPGPVFPRVPGHEIAGVIDKVGLGVDGCHTGQRVGVGWHGGHCGHCENCRHRDFVLCKNLRVPGIRL
jgi:D-arabinose 1-dehydrogenase-like Zn-dependent alcohol dehydrogenase